MKKIGSCVFPNENELIFQFGEREYEILKIDINNNTLLLKGFENFTPILVFFNIEEFHEFGKDFYPDYYI